MHHATTMQKPVIHLNGSARQNLVDDYCAAAGALRLAIEAAENAAPNARDYYPLGPEAFRAAVADHGWRIRGLREIHQAYLDLAEHCANEGT